jgi:hypothetical protein
MKNNKNTEAGKKAMIFAMLFCALLMHKINNFWKDGIPARAHPNTMMLLQITDVSKNCTGIIILSI